MIIDFRARPNTDVFAASDAGPAFDLKWKRWQLQEPAPESLDSYVAAMDAAGVDIGVFTGRLVLRNGVIRNGFPNEHVAECSRRFPRRILGFAGADMSDPRGAAKKIQRCVRELGLRGISLDPRLSGVAVGSRDAYPIYETAAELGLPVVFTMGPFVGDYSDPYQFDQPTLDFPTVDFVCSHAPWPQVTEFLGLAYRRANVYLEPSLYWRLPGNDPLFEAANGFLCDQVIYGSGYPFNRLDAIREFRERIDWKPDAWHKVSYANAARLLKLEPAAPGGPANQRKAS